MTLMGQLVVKPEHHHHSSPYNYMLLDFFQEYFCWTVHLLLECPCGHEAVFEDR